jgi:NAD(P)-dependent dehydrogenase (short-subunit alcohol dehydrogenase family)
MSDQYTMQNPLNQYPKPDFPKQTQSEPGLSSEMTPEPDHGEQTYRGSERLKGRKALITGGDSGIGRAAAIAFAREGADVAINYLPEEQSDADEVVKLIEEAGQKAFAIPGDLKDEDFCKEVIARTVEELGGLDILVNNAAKQIAVEDILDLTTEQFDHTFKTNIYATFWLSKAALPHLPEGATIINTTSVQAYEPSGTLLDYASTKAAIKAFTQALADQVLEKGIRVNAVAPGPFWTPLQPSHGQPAEKVPVFGKDNSKFGRPGQPAEIAPIYVLLASQESSYMTGEIIGVTGGMPIA